MNTKTVTHALEVKVGVQVAANITGTQLRELRQSLDQSLSEFGWTLKRAIDPQAAYPYTRQYISRLEKGQDAITPELAGAFWSIAAAFDDVAAGVGGAVRVGVLAMPNQIVEGTYVPPSVTVER